MYIGSFIPIITCALEFSDLTFPTIFIAVYAQRASSVYSEKLEILSAVIT